MPLVSIVIPAYNAARTVELAIRSAMDQVHPETEIIVVDDGSTDDTAMRAERMGARVLRQPNQGPGAARNLALQVAQGEFVQFLDADDVLHPRKVEACLAEGSGDDIVFSHQAFFEDGTPPLASTDLHLGGRWWQESIHFSPERQLASVLQFPVGTLRPLHRRAQIMALGGFDPLLRNLEDILLNVRLVLGGARFQQLPLRLVFCREHASPGRLRYAPGALAHAARGEELILKAIMAADALDRPGVRDALASRWASLARRQMLAGDHDLAREALETLAALGHRPQLVTGNKPYNILTRTIGLEPVVRMEGWMRGRCA